MRNLSRLKVPAVPCMDHVALLLVLNQRETVQSRKTQTFSITGALKLPVLITGTTGEGRRTVETTSTEQPSHAAHDTQESPERISLVAAYEASACSSSRWTPCCVCGTRTANCDVNEAACIFYGTNQAFLACLGLIVANGDGALVWGRAEGLINQSRLWLGIRSAPEQPFISIQPKRANDLSDGGE